MKFSEAVKAMENGAKVRRKLWYSPNDYIYIDTSGRLQRPALNNLLDTQSLFGTDDWEIYPEPQKPTTIKLRMWVCEKGPSHIAYWFVEGKEPRYYKHTYKPTTETKTVTLEEK